MPAQELLENNIRKLKEYHKTYGNFHVPRTWKKDLLFSRWVEAIRRHPERLHVRQREQLKNIGFDFNMVTGWDDMFLQLEAFYEAYGHAYVPSRQPWEALFNWTCNQRSGRSLLTARQLKQLKSVDFDWEVYSDADIRWSIHYQELIRFKREYGHTRVPQGYKENRTLASWVQHQRSKRAQNKLSRYRIRLLNEAGFLWKKDIASLRDLAWEKRYAELMYYKKKNGHIERLKVQKEHYQLGLWMVTQQVRQKNMPAARKEKLEAIGFNFAKGDYAEARWNEMYTKLKAHVEQYGSARVSKSVDFQLAVWVQRQKRDKVKLSPDKRKKLEQLGIHWSNVLFQKIWNARFEELKAFKKQHGHFSVSRKDQPKLFEWMQFQKQLKSEKKLSRERENKLHTLGFLWKGEVEKQKTAVWDSRYAEFAIFRKKHGSRYILMIQDHPALYRWAMRQLHNKKKLSAPKIQKLDAIGFDWNWHRSYFDVLWEERYLELVAYKRKHGHCDVPQGHASYASLGSWVNLQRLKKPSGERKSKLSALGFSWSGEILKNRWQQRVNEFLKLKKANKLETLHAHMPLYSWIYQQKKNFSKLPIARKQILLRSGIVTAKG